jgi:vacuolar-type H+-ATPase subunit E/Vma4
MGHRELLDTLRAEADAKVRQLWEDARARAAEMAKDADERSALSRESCSARIGREAQQEVARELFDAGRKAQAVELQAEAELRERLFALAREALAASGEARGREFFERLASELPKTQWKSIYVNPSDITLAGELFPTSEVISDPGIAGGLVAHSACGKLRVLATLEKRLELLWHELLPNLMRDAREAI